MGKRLFLFRIFADLLKSIFNYGELREYYWLYNVDKNYFNLYTLFCIYYIENLIQWIMLGVGGIRKCRQSGYRCGRFENCGASMGARNDALKGAKRLFARVRSVFLFVN